MSVMGGQGHYVMAAEKATRDERRAPVQHQLWRTNSRGNKSQRCPVVFDGSLSAERSSNLQGGLNVSSYILIY